MAKPIKTKAGTWRIQVFMGYDADGKRVYFKETLSTYKEASQLIAIKELERKSSSGVCSNITVEAAIKKYIDSVDAVLSPSTIAGYAQLARNAYSPINAIKLPSLSTADVQRCINIYAKTHSPKTVSNAYGLLHRALGFSGKRDIYKITLPQKYKPSITIPTDEQLITLIELTEHPGMRQAILLAAFAGLRRSEIAALKWDSIDFQNSTVTILEAIVKGKDGTLYAKGTKTDSSQRTVLVGPEIMKGFVDLKDLGMEQPIGLTPDAITRRFERICKKAGFVGLTFHGLRHYQASVMMAEGIPDKYAMERMGHATTNMLKNVYQHTMSDMQHKLSTKLNENISNRIAQATQNNSEQYEQLSFFCETH